MDILRGFENPIRFTEEEIKKCEDSKDFRKIFFDYYIFVIELVTISVSIRADSPGINKTLSKLDWGILIGLLNRIRKTMYAQLPLIVEKKHNEVLMMLDRSILESCLNISWIIENLSEESSKKFVACAIKKDLDLENLIHENSSNQGRELYEVEKRLINQRNLRISESGMEESEIRDLARQYPDIKTLFKEAGDNGTMYAFGYTMQSHTVHGDWIGIRYMGYLKDAGDIYLPIVDDNEFDPVQLLSNITFIFDILTQFYLSILDINLNNFFENEKEYIGSFYNKHNELNNITLK